MKYVDLNPAEKEELQQELMQMARKKSFKRKLISLGIAAVILILAVLGGWIYGRNQAKSDAAAEINELNEIIEELINTPMVAGSVAPQINLETYASEIREVAELATVEYLFTDAARFTDSKQIKSWSIPFTEKSFTLKWDGVIKAGVDLDRLSLSVDAAAGVITVSVPPAQILSYEIDIATVEVLDEKDNVFNPISVSDKIKFDAATEEAMKARAVENGLLEKAWANAQTVISNIFFADAAIQEHYTIEFVIQNQEV